VRQPRILIFDEATSALDVASERIVQTALSRVARNRTTIVIAHQLSTIKDADNIVVVANGEVVQQGTHSHLLADIEGPYSKLVIAQRLVKGAAEPTVDYLSEPREYIRPNYKGGRRVDQTLKSSKVIILNREKEVADKSSDVLSSFWSLLAEQKKSWAGNLIMILATMGAASKFDDNSCASTCLTDHDL
jgi:ATP-binding cassette subfamily B (MDR/TAP) protein 1